VLKLSPDPVDLEAYALRRWDGGGAVRLLAADEPARALLLERCEPGRTLDALDDEALVAAGCELARALHRSPDDEDRQHLPQHADGVVCHGDLNPGNVLSARGGKWVAIDPLPVIAPPAYDATSLVWCRRDWLLAQPDPRAVLDRRVAQAAAVLEQPREDIRAWTVRRAEAILKERAAWGGYDAGPFRRVIDLLGGPARYRL
jgi:streptomycin 6-kinase